jgi:PEP-CTERM motif
MKKLMYVMLCVSLGLVLCGTAIASPAIDSAVITTRIWNDNPTSIVTTSNLYAASITIKDEQVVAGGWANLHDFRLSADGGSTAASFANGDAFSFAADVTITGTGNSEAGLQVAPWWSPHGDGKFMANTGNGEIAAFGGRLPFYSFNAQSLTYIKGDTIRMGVVYRPNSLNAGDPATIEYLVTMGATTYSSGPKPFDQGSLAEDPPHGLWGMLTPAQVGGYFQPQVGTAGNWEQATFGNMVYVPEPATMMILGLGSLFLARRRK